MELTKEQKSIVRICELLQDTISNVQNLGTEHEYDLLRDINYELQTIILSYEPNA